MHTNDLHVPDASICRRCASIASSCERALSLKCAHYAPHPPPMRTLLPARAHSATPLSLPAQGACVSCLRALTMHPPPTPMHMPLPSTGRAHYCGDRALSARTGLVLPRCRWLGVRAHCAPSSTQSPDACTMVPSARILLPPSPPPQGRARACGDRALTMHPPFCPLPARPRPRGACVMWRPTRRVRYVAIGKSLWRSRAHYAPQSSDAPCSVSCASFLSKRA